MRRWLLNLAAASSLVLCVATAALWWWTGLVVEHVEWRGRDASSTTERYFGVKLARGAVSLIDEEYSNSFVPLPGPTGWGWTRRPPDGAKDRDMRGLGFWGQRGFRFRRLAQGPPVTPATIRGFSMSFPLWAAMVALALPAAPWCARLARARRLLRRGLCSSCGYDLRASPGRCPECGTANRASAPAA
jgi:hypothetical protein